MEDGDISPTTGKIKVIYKNIKFHIKTHQQRPIHSSRWVRIITAVIDDGENVIIDCANFAIFKAIK
jgi:GTP cyclohydrolase FolE2